MYEQSKRMEDIYLQHKPVNQMTTENEEVRLTPAWRAFRKQWGRWSEQIADKVSRKYPLLTAPIGILYFLISK